MKVTEIISLNETNPLTDKVFDLFGRAVSKAGGKTASKLMSKSDFIEHEAMAIAGLAKSRGISIQDAVKLNNLQKEKAVDDYIARAIENARIKNPDFKPSVQKTAQLRQEAEEYVGISALSKEADVQKKILAKAEAEHGKAIIAKAGEKVEVAHEVSLIGLKAWGLYEYWIEPISIYNSNMNAAKQHLDSGSWTIEHYHYIENQELSALLGKLAIALVARGASKTATMLLANDKTKGVLGKLFPNLLHLTATAAIAWFGSLLNNPKISGAISTFMFNDYVAGNGSVAGQSIPGLGSLAAEAKRVIMGDVKQPASTTATQPAAPATGTTQPTTPATGQGTKPAEPASTYDPNQGFGFNPRLDKANL